MAGPLELAPNEGQQRKFLESSVREVLYGGAGGGGKTWALLMEPLAQLRVEDDRWRKREIARSTGHAIHFRREMPRLLQTIDRARTLYRQVDPGATYSENTHIWTFPCGYKIQFAHMETEKDRLNYGGQEFTCILFDELTEFSEEQYLFLCSRLRSSDPVLRSMLSVRSATNPIGTGLHWVRKRFVEPAPPETVVREIVRLRDGSSHNLDRLFIPARLQDNPHLSTGEYEAELLGKPAHIREAILEGNWWIVPGAYFANHFVPSIHVCEPFELPTHWPIIRGCDWGSRAPACCLWGAIDNDNNIWIVDEEYGPGVNGVKFGRRILELEERRGWLTSVGHSRYPGYIDAGAFSDSGAMGPSPGEAMVNMGLTWWPADKSRKAGWSEIIQRLEMRGGAGGRTPGLIIFDRCKNLIRTLPALKADENDMDDVDTKQEDHAADALRYLCMSRPLGITPEEEGDADLKRWERLISRRETLSQDRSGNDDWHGYG